ncbi:CGNR zinc finger domain-containing protein [Nonomuraea fuscirosea]|uniref:CGNR zinc finger domain-containing protein n=1 Tax=Nonomuraea fuscirosea TaxID=1291556 RepID=UPI000D085EB0|nr:CGNR zinc finger domain-containing protein [Nonomuraea fuscirosea]
MKRPHSVIWAPVTSSAEHLAGRNHIQPDQRDGGGRTPPLLQPTITDDRLTTCASDRCGLRFVDRSQGGRRRWCSMTRCGNRTKAQRHHLRTRTP